ncbi:MAG: amidohydrolase family protein [Williamsia herbipolensis]|nr:amidohydrolase family protein [Williamsia herbipolensis]
MDLLLAGGELVDGTGAPRRRCDVGVLDGRIVIAPSVDAPADLVVDVSGFIVCPGIVDIHTHSDLTLLANPLGDSKIRQGVTTEVVGNCGLGLAPVPPDGVAGPAAIRAAVGYLDLDPDVPVGWHDFDGYLATVEAAGPAMNVASFLPHLPLHASTVGLDDRPAGTAQIDAMVGVLERACDDGAVGLSTGLVYAPLCFVREDELMALGATVARRGRLFAWHVLDYGDALIPSVAQAIRVARATGCRTQISHLTAVGRRNWASLRTALELIDDAIADGVDIGVDTYPYLAGNAPLSQLLPSWAQEGGPAQFAPMLRAPSHRARVRAAWTDHSWDWRDIVVNALSGEFADTAPAGLIGATIADLAAVRQVEADDVALDLLAEYGASVLMVAYGRSDENLRAVLEHPATVVASDGQAIDPAGPTGAAGRPHPRSYGCFPRYLAHYADDLEDGIRRCTSAAAARVGLTDRGVVADGRPADLFVLDPTTLTDTATFEHPQQFPAGIEMVLVNGAVVLDGRTDTGARPGQVLRPGAIPTDPSGRTSS